MLWCCFFGRRSARKRNRGSVLAFARVPTSSGSDQSGIIGSRNEFNHSIKRKVENKENEDIEKHQRFSSRETNSSHGYSNKCHHNTISTKWEQEKLNLRSHKSQYNCQEPFWSSLHCSRMLEKNENLQGKPTITRQDTISNSSLKESKAEDLEDELVSYLREVKERLDTHDSFKDGL